MATKINRIVLLLAHIIPISLYFLFSDSLSQFYHLDYLGVYFVFAFSVYISIKYLDLNPRERRLMALTTFPENMLKSFIAESLFCIVIFILLSLFTSSAEPTIIYYFVYIFIVETFWPIKSTELDSSSH